MLNPIELADDDDDEDEDDGEQAGADVANNTGHLQVIDTTNSA